MGLFGKKKVVNYEAPAGASFVMPIKDVFKISGLGVAIIGTVEVGHIGVYDTVEITDGISAEVTGIECARTSVASAEAGQQVALLIADVIPGTVQKGMVAYKM